MNRLLKAREELQEAITNLVLAKEHLSGACQILHDAHIDRRQPLATVRGTVMQALSHARYIRDSNTWEEEITQ